MTFRNVTFLVITSFILYWKFITKQYVFWFAGRGAYVEGQCKANQHRCKSSECIPNAWVCDGAPVCQFNDLMPSTDDLLL